MDGRFDFSNGYVILRIICGAFFIPHIIGKISARDASVGFFRAAGFYPPQLWSYFSMLAEIAIASFLVFGFFSPVSSYLAGAYLLIAAAANFKVSRRWLWHIGGSEWAVFWAICCLLAGYFGP